MTTTVLPHRHSLHNWATEILTAHLLSAGLPPLQLVPIRQWGDPETWAPFPSPTDLAVALRKYYAREVKYALGSHPSDDKTFQVFGYFLTMTLDQVNWDVVVARLAEDAKHRLSDAAVQGRKEFAKDCQGKTWEECIPAESGEAEENGNVPPSAQEGAAK